MVALLDGLVVQVAEFGGAIGHAESKLNQPTDQETLELQAYPSDIGLAPHADLDLLLQRLRLVPGVPTEWIGAPRKDPARIIGNDGVLGRVPVDVDERIEVPVR
ncbi:Uncharacterised protein [Mycobacteroides abscessus subsp. abscessus]|nr:Uncharacterised protein [Mycobacteroides abscessus subsp. abscessus]